MTKNIITFILGIAIFLLGTLVRCESDSLTPKTKIKTLVKTVEVIKKEIVPIKGDIEIQKVELIKFKTLRDTVKIIETQDVIIYKQGEVIVKQDTIIQFQDSIIEIQSEDNKALKKSLRKQKFKTFGVGLIGAVGIVGTVLILKK